MRKIIVFLFVIIAYNKAKSQEFTFIIPDYDNIKKEIQDSSSSFYYQNLSARLESYDTTLTNEEYRYLYYGYIYQEKYQPYWTSPDEEELLKYYQSEKIKEKDYDKIIQLATNSINEFPFDLRQMNFLSYIYHLKGDENMANKVSIRFNGTLGAIISSGDGKTCETGFHVITVSHEYVFLNMFQFQMKSQTLVEDCDYLELQKDERNIDGIYFNIEKLFEKNMKNFK
jgi:hypothetical protein